MKKCNREKRVKAFRVRRISAHVIWRRPSLISITVGIPAVLHDAIHPNSCWTIKENYFHKYLFNLFSFKCMFISPIVHPKECRSRAPLYEFKRCGGNKSLLMFCCQRAAMRGRVEEFIFALQAPANECSSIWVNKWLYAFIDISYLPLLFVHILFINGISAQLIRWWKVVPLINFTRACWGFCAVEEIHSTSHRRGGKVLSRLIVDKSWRKDECCDEEKITGVWRQTLHVQSSEQWKSKSFIFIIGRRSESLSLSSCNGRDKPWMVPIPQTDSN